MRDDEHGLLSYGKSSTYQGREVMVWIPVIGLPLLLAVFAYVFIMWCPRGRPVIGSREDIARNSARG